MTATDAPRAIDLRVEPSLAEATVFRALARRDPDATGDLARYRGRAAPLYDLEEPARRDAAFEALALDEFAQLGLAEPLLRALGERSDLSARTRTVLVGEARGRHDEGATCESGGAHLGLRVEAARFDEPNALLAWARHVLGHAADTLDADFGFVPGWEDGPGGRLGPAAQARLHRLWDVSVDGRLAADGRLLDPAAQARHRAAIAADLPGASPRAVDLVVERLRRGPRPAFGQLLAWASRPADLVAQVAPGEHLERGLDRCPLCRFPSDDVRVPDAPLAALVADEYPDWRPEEGLCARCTDRYRFVAQLGGRP